MSELTAFQKKCEEELEKRLKLFRVSISNREIGVLEKTWFADRETFIEASIGNLRIWIYDDEAEVEKDGKHFHFEAPDFDREDDLIRAFGNKVVALLQNVEDDDDDGSSKRIVLFTWKQKKRKGNKKQEDIE